MSQDIADAELLAQLLDGTPFDEVAAHYEDERACFDALRDEAKRSLPSFDAYPTLYEMCRDDGPADRVDAYLERNGGRMLKNMIMQMSDAGERYYVKTAAELSRRIDAVHDIGIDADTATLRSVVATIIEHAIDEC